MVIKGKSVAGAKRLAVHLQRTDTNERMEVLERRGVVAEDLTAGLREMEAVASAAPNCKRPFYHASINTREDERLAPEQRDKAINRLEQELGLEGQPRIVVAHVKHGREHVHIVWSRIDLETMRTISDSHNYRKHELVARELEREFGHARVQGAHIERDGQERPERSPSHKELQQAERTKITPEAAREHLTALWRATDNGASFKAALEQSGWVFARGDRRDFVAIDLKGGAHSIARRIDGATTQMVRDRFADLDRSTLPSVAECRQTSRARQPEKTHQAKEAHPPRGLEPANQRTPVTASQARPAKADRHSPRPADGAIKAASNALDGIATTFESLLGGAPSRPKDDAATPTPAVNKAARAIEARQEQMRQADEGDRSARLAKYLQDFSREVPQSQERDVQIERDRGRERKRGE